MKRTRIARPPCTRRALPATRFVAAVGGDGELTARIRAAGTRLTIASVTVTGPDTVAINLASPPSGKTRLRYASTGTPLTCPGKTVGPRGNLRDSDTTPSQGGYELFNWGLHFEVPVE